MNLSTNLVRRKEELEAVKLSTETEMLQEEAGLKKQELKDANLLVDQLTQQLKSWASVFYSQTSTFGSFIILYYNMFISFTEVTESINQRNRDLESIKAEKDKLKVLLYWV